MPPLQHIPTKWSSKGHSKGRIWQTENPAIRSKGRPFASTASYCREVRHFDSAGATSWAGGEVAWVFVLQRSYLLGITTICINASENFDLNFTIFRQKVQTHLSIFFAEIFPNEFPGTTRHTKAGIPAKKNKRQNCSETTLLIAILAF